MATTTNVLADRYEVRRRLGEGGMGVVYLAYDRNLKTEVVVKMPLPSAMADPGFVERFTHEIRAMVQLRHPHVVPILDVGTHGKRPFAVMAFLGGGSLQDKGIPAAPSTLAAWLTAIASALDFVHTQKTLHRDVKPANILFDQHGFAFLSDFGVAKVLAEGPSDAIREPLTGKGLVIGTAEYMAPELIRARKDVDGRADQYALAATVYEVLSGRTPFIASEAQAVMVMQVTEQVPPLSGVSPGLEAAVLRGLAKDPAARFRTCAEFAEAVLAAASGSPPPLSRTSGAARIPATRMETPAVGQVARTRVEAPPTDRIEEARPKTGRRTKPAQAAEEPRGGSGGMIALVAVIAVMVLAAGGIAAFLLTGDRGQPTRSGPAAVDKDNEKDRVKDKDLKKSGDQGFSLMPLADVKVGAGGTARPVVKIDRTGYPGPITFSIPELPDGVSLRAPLEAPPGLKEFGLVLDATESVKPFDRRIQLVGKGSREAQTVEFRLVVEGKPRLKFPDYDRPVSLRVGQASQFKVTLEKENCRDKPVRLSLSAASRAAFRDVFEEQPPETLPGGTEEFTLKLRPKRKPPGALRLQIEAELESDPSVAAKLTIEFRVTE